MCSSLVRAVGEMVRNYSVRHKVLWEVVKKLRAEVPTQLPFRVKVVRKIPNCSDDTVRALTVTCHDPKIFTIYLKCVPVVEMVSNLLHEVAHCCCFYTKTGRLRKGNHDTEWGKWFAYCYRVAIEE